MGFGMGGRKLIKAAAALIVLGYCSLLVYQNGVTFNFQESRPVQVSELSLETSTETVNKSVRTNNITLDDIFISVKTTKLYQKTRLPIILKTWFQLAKQQIWFFTDTNSEEFNKTTDGHMVNTNCPASHERIHLCCKMAYEYDFYIESDKKWFCHFDDDNYVNVPRLVSVLQNYDPLEDWYLGRNSVFKPVKIRYKYSKKGKVSFWFATGGAGFCLSKSLAYKMLPIASSGSFVSICEKLRMPDDVSMGFIIELLVKRKLTIVPEFHSHLEQMKLLNSETFRDQISFSYSEANNNGEWNVVNVPGFDTTYDPTRFYSLHCFLFPHFKFCPR